MRGADRIEDARDVLLQVPTLRHEERKHGDRERAFVHERGDRFLDAFLFRERAYVPIGIGAWLGTIMAFNVWVLIWPNQKKILGLVPATDEEKNKARRVAFLASRTNTMLSIPMLFFMSSSYLFHAPMFA